MCRTLHDKCKRYFDQHFRVEFFVGEEYKESIFCDSFVKLWENIEVGNIYVEDDVLKGRNGERFTCSLTTYLISIAKNEYKEITRDKRKSPMFTDLETAERLASRLYEADENDKLRVISHCIAHMTERCWQIMTLYWYENMTLDEMLLRLPTYQSKDALKTEKYKCMKKLKESANEMYNLKHKCGRCRPRSQEQ